MSKEQMFWYKFVITDYQRDTAHLSILEHGAYRLLLDHSYLYGGVLPPKIDQIFRMTGAIQEDEKEAIRSVLKEFFEANGK